MPGLRREEVAVLAGVSADYYARLEQGRERNPSAQVLDAIGHALRLSRDGREHLFRLAGMSPRRRPDNPRDRVEPKLLELLDSFPLAVAYIFNPAYDVLAANPVARALLAPFGDEINMPRMLFLHPLATTVFADWEMLRRSTVASLRLHSVQFPDDPDLAAVITDLRASSEDFRRLWDENFVGGLPRAYKVFVHPDAGRIELHYQILEVTDAPGQQLMVGSPEKGSRAEEAVAYLAATAVSGTP